MLQHKRWDNQWRLRIISKSDFFGFNNCVGANSLCEALFKRLPERVHRVGLKSRQAGWGDRLVVVSVAG